MKMHLFGIGFYLTASIGFAGAETPKEKYTTVSGAEFILTDDAPEKMQPAYQDDKGLIWGKVADGTLVNGPAGSLLFTTQEKAEGHCKKMVYGDRQGRLPTAEELIRLRESMSSSARPESFDELLALGQSINPTYAHASPALPDIVLCFPGVDKCTGLGQWSSTVFSSEDGDGNAFAFMMFTGDGSFYLKSTSAIYTSFRCVIDGK